jgi:microcompartment protein CcmL/EutN
MDVDKVARKGHPDGVKGEGEDRDEVFENREQEEERLRREAEEEKRRKREEEARKKVEALEKAAAARELGRELAAKRAKSRIDPRYQQVRVERSNGAKGREMNRKKRADMDELMEEEDTMTRFLFQDERWLRNYSIHSVERAVNVSCSMNPKTGLCYTCLGEPHKAWEGREGEPIVLVLSDQHFPANVPAMDGGECVRIVRVEDGSLRELVEELMRILKRWMVKPGSIIMLGSLSQLSKDSTAFYAAEWKQYRNKLLREYGNIMVVPALPLVGEPVKGEHITRSLVEFMDWFDDLQDPEARIMRTVRRRYVGEFLNEDKQVEEWANNLQNHRMPISLYGEGTTRYISRGYGRLPKVLKEVDEHEEQVWVGRICGTLNRDFGLSLATATVAGRSLASVREAEEEETGLVFKVVGASNAVKSTESLRRKGMEAEKAGRRGWSLSVEKDVEDLIKELSDTDMKGKVLLFHCMDNSTYMSMDRTGGSSLPKKESGIFHIPGKLIVASGYALEQMVETMLRIAGKVKPGLVEIVLPMPRYLAPCCEKHRQGRTEKMIEEEGEKVIRAVSGIKKEVVQMVSKAHAKNVVVVSPLEVLGVRGKVAEVAKHMEDGAHLGEEARDKVMDYVVQRAEEHVVLSKRGPTERSENSRKRGRFASAGEGSSRGSYGGWRGGQGGSGGSRGGGRNHSYY